MHQYRLVCRLYYLGLGRDLSTNLTIIAISLFYNLPSKECWFKTGYWDHERYVAIHEIARNLGPDLCNALPIVHDLTGCDSTSSFAGHGKVDPWRKVVSNIAKWPGLLEAGTCTVPSQEVLNKLATGNKINDLRYRLFCTSQRMVSNLPPLKMSYISMHCGHVTKHISGGDLWWRNRLFHHQQDMDGLSVRTQYISNQFFLTNNTTPKSLLQVIACKCDTNKSACKGRCTCAVNGLSCTDACQCQASDMCLNKYRLT